MVNIFGFKLFESPSIEEQMHHKSRRHRHFKNRSQRRHNFKNRSRKKSKNKKGNLTNKILRPNHLSAIATAKKQCPLLAESKVLNKTHVKTFLKYSTLPW